LIGALPNGAQVGVVAFSDRAMLAAPLSTNEATAERALDGLTANGGTAIGEGLNLALDQLAQRPTDPQGQRAPAVVVLLSDGESNLGRAPATVAQRAQQEGVTVYTVGIGERGVETQLNRQQRVGLDETTLQSIASTSGGEYYYAQDAAELERVYAHLGSQIQWVEEPTEVTALASAIGAVFLTAAGALALGWFGRLP
jgi:Ca-activated chloride channel family protein